MGMTMTQKILAKHAHRDSVSAGDLLVSQVDLVLANDITGPPAINEFEKIGKPVWIRHVVVPGITFQREELLALGRYLKTLTNMEKLEVLPYHSMGKVKYDSLGIEYPLLGTPQLSKAEAAQAEAIIREGMAE